MKTVFILGAGASMEAGAPSMAGFMRKARELQARQVFGSATHQIQDVLDAAYKDLKPIHVKSSINYTNIEELFSAIDIAQLIGTFGSRAPDKINELRKSIVVFIYRTIEETIQIPFRDGAIGVPGAYDMLAKLVRKKIEKTARLGLKELSFITFNYDTCLEFGLVRNGIGVDYCLENSFLDTDEQRYQVSIPVLKLHGSINWATCPQCKAIVPTEIDPYRRASLISLVDEPDPLKLMLGSRIAEKGHSCGSRFDPLPLIVPPTWNKSTSSGALQSVWRAAANELASAERVVVIGYSLPPTDMFFKYLFALGSHGDAHLEEFVVINGPEGEPTKAAFQSLLGPMTADGFVFYPFVFSSVEHILSSLLFE